MEKAAAQAQQDVQRGAKLLDSKPAIVPSDWRQRVDLSRFDINDVTCCLLQQLFGTFGKGCMALEVDVCAATPRHNVMAYGFMCRGDTTRDVGIYAEALQACWLAYLRAAQAAVLAKEERGGDHAPGA